jgi:SdpC family antimicrobial peptide
MSRFVRSAIATGAAGALALTLAPTATASTESFQIDEAGSITNPVEYSTRDVISFFLLATGPLMESHPELASNLGLINHAVDDATIDAFVAEILEIEPNFDARITEPIQSGDPLRAQAAIESLTLIAQKYVAGHQSANRMAATPSGSAQAKAKTVTVVWGALVVAVAGVVAVGAIFVVLYSPTDSSTRFESELLSLDVAAAF